MSLPMCPNCDVVLTSAELQEGWCETCGKQVPAFIRSAAMANQGPVAPPEVDVQSIPDPPRRPMEPRPVAFLIGSFFLLLLGLGFLSSLYHVWVWYRCSSWPTTEGRVKEVGTRKEVTRSRRGGNVVLHKPLVMYEYKVAGQEHIGTRISVGTELSWGCWNPETAENLARHYKAGGHVKVMYNPDSPRDAYLERGLTFWLGLWLVLSAVLLYLAGRLFFAAIRSFRGLPVSGHFSLREKLLFGVFGVVAVVSVLAGLAGG